MTRDGALLDEILPRYDVSATYSIQIRATPDRIYGVLQEGIPSGALTRILTFLRRIPSILRKRGNVSRTENAFYKLKQSQNREIVIGIVGQFWKPVARTVPIQSLDDFLNFDRDGFCKAALNLRIEEKSSQNCVLITETRVQTLGSAKRPFLEYWRLIGPFSGIIRKEILRKIKSKAEKF